MFSRSGILVYRPMFGESHSRENIHFRLSFFSIPSPHPRFRSSPSLPAPLSSTSLSPVDKPHQKLIRSHHWLPPDLLPWSPTPCCLACCGLPTLPDWCNDLDWRVQLLAAMVEIGRPTSSALVAGKLRGSRLVVNKGHDSCDWVGIVGRQWSCYLRWVAGRVHDFFPVMHNICWWECLYEVLLVLEEWALHSSGTNIMGANCLLEWQWGTIVCMSRLPCAALHGMLTGIMVPMFYHFLPMQVGASDHGLNGAGKGFAVGKDWVGWGWGSGRIIGWELGKH